MKHAERLRAITPGSALARIDALEHDGATSEGELGERPAALASYARQAGDDSLRTLSTRIQARAIRRCGELLKQIAPSKGGRPAKTKDGPDLSSRKGAARSAGLSERQQKDALRVASIPKAKFERGKRSMIPSGVALLSR